MPHSTPERLHGYRNRGLPILIDITTDLDAVDFTNIRFNFAGDAKTSLTPTDTSSGISVVADLTVADMGMAEGLYPWELIAEINSEDVSIARGLLHVDPEPT